MTGNQTATAALRAAVRVATISEDATGRMPVAALTELMRVLKHHFPIFHERLEHHQASESGGIVFHWPGHSGESPVVLMGHLAVVPVDDKDTWDFEPFGAELDAGRILGRGTLDDKGAVVGILAAAEELLAQGFTPTRDIWFSFGTNEEVSGDAIANSVYAIALADTASQTAPAGAHAPLADYLTVWALCGLSALAAALILVALHQSDRKPATTDTMSTTTS